MCMCITCQFDIRMMSNSCFRSRSIAEYERFLPANLLEASMDPVPAVPIAPCIFETSKRLSWKYCLIAVYYYSFPYDPLPTSFFDLNCQWLDLVAVALYPHSLARQEEVDVALLRVATSMLQAAS